MRITLSLISAALLAACGQTGPLYLPDEGISTPVEIRTGSQPAPPPAEAAAPVATDDPGDEEPARPE